MKKGKKYYQICETGILVVLCTGAAYSNTDNSIITSKFEGTVLYAIGPLGKIKEVGEQGLFDANDFKELSD